jgi:ABC-type multidrug transport system permease subunit
MSVKRIYIMFMARNREFLRDRAAFGWNIVFPFLLVAGFSIIFSGSDSSRFKVGVFPCQESSELSADHHCVPPALESIKHITWVAFSDLEAGLDKLKHHKIDLMIRVDREPYPYWTSDTAPNGYIVQHMMAGSLAGDTVSALVRQQDVASRQIRYIDWFFPGVVGMSMMFSALYGVGYVIVRYRKNGVLKRLEATPLTAFEYLSAQLLSRLCMIAFTVLVLWVGCTLIFHFQVAGSYLDLAVVLALGSLSLISLGLVVASRAASEEFAEGILNFITWPMMFLSGVWFSIEGAPGWLKAFSQCLPLTHLLSGARKIMNDGATLAEVGPELAALAGTTLLLLSLSALLFKWNK